MMPRSMWWLVAAGGMSVVALSQDAIPSDPLEMVTGQVRAVRARPARANFVQLVGRARNTYALRSAKQGYDLKVTFTVNSAGQTDYDGVWQMEDVFDPAQGLRWTAKGPSYSITRISANGGVYGEETASYIPLRLQEARAALFDPIPGLGSVARGSIRTSAATYHGEQLTCVLLADRDNPATAGSGRRWEETEECIDPKSGLLHLHSQVPGRYYAYDYSNAPQLAGHVLPRRVTVTEGGRTVTEISVESLTELSSADPTLFVPTDEMKAQGRPIAMVGAQKISRNVGPGAPSAGAGADAVCVFGLVTPSGQLVEAHSLQPSNPNSQAAVEAARQMNFSPPAALPGAQPQQHFIFVIAKFGPSR
jgi:hypothetical protein